MTTFTKALSTTAAIALIAGAVAFSGAANAGSHGGGQKMMKRFGMIDTNGDKKITPDEVMEWRGSVFASMDADDDNELTMEEFMAVSMGDGQGKNPEKKKMKQEKKRAKFKPMDTDGSGKVSEAEWTAAGKAGFAKADTDGDGAMSFNEFRDHHKN